MSTELMRVQADDGTEVLFEVDGEGMADVAYDGAVQKARETLENSLADVQAIAVRALDTFRAGARRPDTVELEFGVKFKAEAGAVFAKTAAEGHIVVRLTWAGPTAGTGEPDDE